MKAVLQYRASPGLRQQISALNFPTVIVDEADKDTFRRENGRCRYPAACVGAGYGWVIDAAPHLRLIQKVGIGVNTIDLDAARRRGIAVSNMPGTNTQAVAEMTLLPMLAMLPSGSAGLSDPRRQGWQLASLYVSSRIVSSPSATYHPRCSTSCTWPRPSERAGSSHRSRRL
jgi:lactate dehydrogenase-like 2-hydroxyacid dehydrogenase